ncbi:hypothetical protein ACFLXB_06790 [Chloroflexota bacterium]
MTSDERSKILKMIQEGKISAEEGLNLMKAIDDQSGIDDTDLENDKNTFTAPEIMHQPPPAHDPEISKTMDKARGLWMIPFWIGVAITILGSWIMYSNMLPEPGFNGMFYCLGLPILILGVLIIMLGWSSKTSRWIFVSVDQAPGETPRRIRLGFPLPLGLASWFFRIFGSSINGIKGIPIDQVIDALHESDDPLVINVDEGDNGEKVQVYIG